MTLAERCAAAMRRVLEAYQARQAGPGRAVRSRIAWDVPGLLSRGRAARAAVGAPGWATIIGGELVAVVSETAVLWDDRLDYFRADALGPLLGRWHVLGLRGAEHHRARGLVEEIVAAAEEVNVQQIVGDALAEERRWSVRSGRGFDAVPALRRSAADVMCEAAASVLSRRPGGGHDTPGRDVGACARALLRLLWSRSSSTASAWAAWRRSSATRWCRSLSAG